MRCNVCLGPAVYYLPYRGINSDNEHLISMFANRSVARCNDCGHVFCYPEIDDLRDYYEADYWIQLRRQVGIKAVVKQGLRRLVRVNPRAYTGVAALKPYFGDVRTCLEIGAGQGDATRYLKKYCEVFVVEPSDKFPEKIASFFEEATGKYDLVFSSHWLEHMAKPRDVMKKIAGMTRLVFVDVPNCEPPYWEYRHFPHPPHVQFFTPNSLRVLVEEFGFRVDFLQTNGAPIEWEKEAGYLRFDTPMLVDSLYIERLNGERGANLPKQKLSRMRDYDRNAEHGRENIRLIGVKTEP